MPTMVAACVPPLFGKVTLIGCAVDHVRVRHDLAVGADDDAGAIPGLPGTTEPTEAATATRARRDGVVDQHDRRLDLGQRGLDVGGGLRGRRHCRGRGRTRRRRAGRRRLSHLDPLWSSTTWTTVPAAAADSTTAAAVNATPVRMPRRRRAGSWVSITSDPAKSPLRGRQCY